MENLKLQLKDVEREKRDAVEVIARLRSEDEERERKSYRSHLFFRLIKHA